MKKNYIFGAFIFLSSLTCESSDNNKSTNKLVSKLNEKGLSGALRGNNKKGDGQVGFLDFNRALRDSPAKYVRFEDTKNPDKSQTLPSFPDATDNQNSGESIVVWSYSEFIKPGSAAAQAVQKDLAKIENTAAGLIHGCLKQ